MFSGRGGGGGGGGGGYPQIPPSVPRSGPASDAPVGLTTPSNDGLNNGPDPRVVPSPRAPLSQKIYKSCPAAPTPPLRRFCGHELGAELPRISPQLGIRQAAFSPS